MTTLVYTEAFTKELDQEKSIPDNFTKCIESNDDKNDKQLKCFYEVISEGDIEKYDKCLDMGGISNYGYSCELTFYNPNYQFPDSYEECATHDKGEILTSPYPRKRCRISIIPTFAYNRDAATRLLNECISRGGNFHELENYGEPVKYPSCHIEFKEGLK